VIKRTNAALDAAVFAEQMSLVSRSRFDLILNVIVATLLAGMLWRLFPPWLAASWLASIWIVAGVRATLRHRMALGPPNLARYRLGWRFYLAGTLVTGALWGATGTVVLETSDPLHYILIVFVLAGVMAGGIVTTAASLRVMLAFLVPTILPVIAILLTRASTLALDMGVMVSIFAIVFIACGMSINRSIVGSLRAAVRQKQFVVELRASEASMAEAQSLARVGGLELDVANETMICTAETLRIIGADPTCFAQSIATLMASVHPDDRSAAEETFRTFRLTGEHRAIEYRIFAKDGSTKTIRARGRKLEGLPGSPARLYLAIQDVSAEKDAADELAYRDRLLDAVTTGTAILLQAESIELGMPEALRTLGESMQLDRIDVNEDVPGTNPPIVVRYNWQVPGIFSAPDASITAEAGDVAAARAQLTGGNVVVGERATGGVPIRGMLRRLGCESILLVPIVVDRKLWGSLGAGMAKRSRSWSANEMSTLRTFASIVGTLIVRNEVRLSLERSEGGLQRANILLETEMQASPDGIMIVDEKGVIISVNQRFIEMWHLPPADLGSIYSDRSLATAATVVKDPRRFTERARFLYDHLDVRGEDEIEFLDGRIIERRTATMKTPADAYLGRVWYFRDITERKRAESLALHMAHYDALTGLANRSVFVEALSFAIAAAERAKTGFAVIYLDLDHFKDVNDTLGHPVGDELLQAVAGRLSSAMRASDTVARFGGDEFAVLVSGAAEVAEAASVAEMLLKAFVDPFSIQGNDIRTSASIGIDLYGPECAAAETLLSHADVALYRAKSEGRGAYRFFTEAMDRAVRTRVTIGAELRIALAAGQLFLMYQPQVAVESGKIIGLEALVRWRHPERGLIGPNVFIPVAESTGIIVPLGQWVLMTACRQAKAWLEDGTASVRMAVNVSGLQFKTPLELEGNIAAALLETGLPPRLLEIELTETVLMDVSLEHSEALARLRESGVTIAIDDFGTGYSSLGYLRQFPVDRIKIAQEFVKDLTTMPGQAAIAKATIGLAHDLGIAVIAEGVETRDQLEALQGWGCKEIQGYYFAKPLSVEDVALAFRNGGVLEPG
jgi:diguanylate cyclase (GGDEF)-like protein